jgi:hypothetical protein
VFFFLFVNQTIAFAILWASVIRYSRSAQIGSTLWVIGMSVIAFTAWDSGNFFNTDTISNDLKNFITIWPIWGFYRGWSEYKEYAGQVAAARGLMLVLPCCCQPERAICHVGLKGVIFHPVGVSEHPAPCVYWTHIQSFPYSHQSPELHID